MIGEANRMDHDELDRRGKYQHACGMLPGKSDCCVPVEGSFERVEVLPRKGAPALQIDDIREGDILVVDASAIDLTDVSIQFPCTVLVAYPTGGKTLGDCIAILRAPQGAQNA